MCYINVGPCNSDYSIDFGKPLNGIVGASPGFTDPSSGIAKFFLTTYLKMWKFASAEYGLQFTFLMKFKITRSSRRMQTMLCNMERGPSVEISLDTLDKIVVFTVQTVDGGRGELRLPYQVIFCPFRFSSVYRLVGVGIKLAIF